MILDNEWPLEKLERCFTKDRKGESKAISLKGLSGIPNALFQCTRTNPYSLTFLDLNGCGLLQAYEFDEVGNFEGLHSLTLANCGLIKIPEKLFKLKRLSVLLLRNNSIKEIQHGICSLQKLYEFDISCNKLTDPSGRYRH